MEPEEIKDPEDVKESQTKQVESEGVVEENDPTGVPYKNRYAEAQRKLEQQTETIEEMTFRMNNLEQRLQPQPPPVVSQPATQSKNDMDEMIAMGPEAYNKKIAMQVQAEMQRKQQLAEAESRISDKFGAGRLQFGVAKVLEYARKNMIDVTTDPVRAVDKILKEMDAPKSQPSAEDRKKTAEAIKNKPESGKRPPAPPVNNKSELMDKVYGRGEIEDVAAVLKELYMREKE